MGASDGKMVSKVDEQTFSNEFESHWVPYSYGVLHPSKISVNYYYVYEFVLVYALIYIYIYVHKYI